VTRSRRGSAVDMRPRSVPPRRAASPTAALERDPCAGVLVRLLGTPSVRVGEMAYEPAAGRVSAALYYLAYRADWVVRDELIGLFWPESDEARARGSLRQLVRSMVCSPCAVGVEIERQRLRWRVASDISAHERIVASGGSCLPPGRGDALLAGFRLPNAPAFEDWLDLERASLHQRWRRRVLERASVARAGDETADAIATLEAWLDHDPLDEGALHRYLRACRVAGRSDEARARFRTFEQLLMHELGFEPPARILEAVGALTSHPPGGVPTARPFSRGEDLEAPGAGDAGRHEGGSFGRGWDAPRTFGSAFVGREREFGRLRDSLLCRAGVVACVIGAGGMGKTRLAVEAARSLEPAYADGAVFVRLVEATTADEAAASLANALACEAGARLPPIDRAMAALRGRRSLVVLDNVEQIEGIEDLVERLRDALPDASWLLTSRRRLALRGAEVLELGGLPFRPGNDGGIADTPSTALFLDRACRLGGQVDLAAEGDAVSDLAQLLAGMPLAIELAAGWARILSVTGTLERLRRDPMLDAPPGHDHEGRHASMRGVFEASWRLLDASRRNALARLSVFRDGCTVQAADHVAGVALSMVVELRDASMLAVTAAGRLVQHPLVERYVRDRVGEDAFDLTEVRARHAGYYLRLLREQEDAGQAGSDDALEILGDEHGNIEVAWAWAIEHEAWAPLIVGAYAMLRHSYERAGRRQRFETLIDAALERCPRDGLTWALLTARRVDQQSEEGYAHMARAVEVARRHDDPFALAWILNHFGEAALLTGRNREGLAALEEAVELLASIGEVHVRACTINLLHGVSTPLEERDRWYRAGVEVRRRSPRPTWHDAGASLWRSSDLLDGHGRYPEALAMIEDTIALMRRHRWSPIELADGLRTAARAHAALGALERASECATEALEISRRHARGTGDFALNMSCFARVRWLMGDVAGARAVLCGPEARLAPPREEATLLEARMALDDGDPEAAARGVATAISRLSAPPAVRPRHRLRADARVLAAEIALAEGRTEAARSLLSEALATTVELVFLPASTEAVVVALPLLPLDLARRALEAVAAHPATPYVVRRRPELRALVSPASDEAVAFAQRDFSTILGEIRCALAAVGESPGAAGAMA
jgi:DNA-binding SARP family transcriptional activator/predicted ATPase